MLAARTHSISRHHAGARSRVLQPHTHALRRAPVSVCTRAVDGEGTASATATVTAPPPPPITLTDKALEHLKKLKSEMKNQDPGALLLRVGVKSGGCSGMSYQMDFEDRSKITGDDMVVQYDNGNFELVINPKSLLYLFGMRLDYSDALIGGGFQFHNPNAVDSCGCGKSFGV